MKRIVLSILVLLLVSMGSIAQHSEMDFCNRHLISDPAASLIVEDQQMANILAGDYDGAHAIDKQDLSLKLWLEESDRVEFDMGFDLEVTIDISVIYVDGSTGYFPGEILSVNYTLVGEYTDMAFWRKSDVIFMQADVTNVTVTPEPGSGNAPSISNMTDVYLEACIHSEKYLPLSSDLPVVTLPNMVAGSNELEITWPPLEGALSYDVEWYHYGWGENGVNDLDNQDPLDPLILDWHGAGRLRLAQNWFRMTRAFPAGRLFFRVRAVGRDVDTGWTAEGDWSCEDVNVFTPSTATGQTTWVDFAGFEESRNWQYQAMFAEHGLKAESVTFADGTGRIRQSVSLNPEDGTAVVQSQTYDFYGRGTLQILPSVEPSIGVNFYENQLIDAAGGAFDFEDYDVHIDASANPLNPGKLSHDSSDPNGIGPGHYWGGADNNVGIYNELTPDAKGYAYGRTLLMADGTSRVKIESGPGETFRMDPSQEIPRVTTHLYGSVSQTELDELFGLEAGFASQYQKHLVVDPNGEATVTITDQQGRTVASYLTGDPSSALLEVDGMDGIIAEEQLTDLTEFNNEEGYHRSLTYTLANAVPTTYSFDYDLTNPLCINGDCGFCPDCSYDVQIRILNEHGFAQALTNVSGSAAFVWDAGINTLNATGLVANSDAVEFDADLGLGTFTVEKTLTIHGLNQTLGNYQNVLESISCAPEPLWTEVPCGDCSSDCVDSHYLMVSQEEGTGYDVLSTFSFGSWNADGALVQIGTATGPLVSPSLSENPVALFDPNQTSIITYSTDFLGESGAVTAIGQAVDACIAECVDMVALPDLDMCDFYRNKLWEDITPGGQYFESLPMEEDENYDPNFWLSNNIDWPYEGTYNNASELRDDWETISAAWTVAENESWLSEHPDYMIFNMLCVPERTEYVVTGWSPTNSEPTLAAYVDDLSEGYDTFYDFAVSATSLADVPWSAGSLEAYLNPLNLLNDTSTTDPSLYQPFAHGVSTPDLVAVDNLADAGFDMWMLTNPELYSDLEIILGEWKFVSNMAPELDGLEAKGDPVHRLQNALQRFVELEYTDGTPNKYASIWYVIDNPDDIGMDEDNLDNLTDETRAFFDLFHYDPDPLLAGANDGVFVKSAESGGVTKWQFFRGVYLFHRQLAVDAIAYWKQWHDLSICTADPTDCITSPQQAFSSSSFPSSKTKEGYQIRMRSNPGTWQILQLMMNPLSAAPNAVEGSYGLSPITTPFWELDEPTVSELALLEFDGVEESICAQMAQDEAQAYIEGNPEFFGYPEEANPPFEQWELQWILDTIPNLNAIATYCVTDPNTYEVSVDVDQILIDAFLATELDLSLTLPSSPSNYTLCGCTNLELTYSEFMDLENDQDPTVSWYTWWAGAGTSQVNFVNHINETFSSSVSNGDVGLWASLCTTSPPTSELTNLPDELGCEIQLDEEIQTDDDLCSESMSDVAFYADFDAWQNEIQEKMLAYEMAYKEGCMAGIDDRENFTMTHDVRDYQYTLYYYDQADNLIKTVAPKGVEKLDLSADAIDNHPDTGLPWSVGAAVAYHRGSEELISNSELWPAHTFVTNYQYNSLQALTHQNTPDGGTTEFFYDDLGRLVASQNAQQASEPDHVFSYSLYDELGRVYEAGEVRSSLTFDGTTTVDTWLTANAIERRDVVKTFYDEAFASQSLPQENLRNRVSAVVMAETLTGMAQAESNYRTATIYSYDIHGNVDNLWQWNATVDVSGEQLKHISYEYDLLNGNVNQVHYQPGQWDQFHHRYCYDGNNRLKQLYTSRDGEIWEQDAKYFYRADGPLARIELGDKKVQGTDYAYNLQGWLKGVNSNTLNAQQDIGQDSHGLGFNTHFASDASGFSLHYHSNDHQTVGANQSFASAHLEEFSDPNSNPINGDITRELFNGNIAAMVTPQHPNDDPIDEELVVMSRYRYDRLNRIKQARTQKRPTAPLIASANNDPYLASASFQLSDDYRTDFKYDENGNISEIDRYGSDGADIDQLRYSYYSNSDGTNRLHGVQDFSSIQGSYGDFADATNLFPDSTHMNDFSYDHIGNLVRDANDGISDIIWTVSGKVKEVIKEGEEANLEFVYDPLGNRVAKIVKKKNPDGTLKPTSSFITQTYVRDAQGNTLATYENTTAVGPTEIVSDHYMQLKDHHLYGSSRLGIRADGATAHDFLVAGPSGNQVNLPDVPTDRTLSKRRYELSNYLGNVLATISDRKIGRPSGNVTWAAYGAEIISQSDYYPFGMQMPGRQFSAEDYRYGFQGQETDDEIRGEGNSVNYKFRMHDPRIGRFFAVDPLTSKYPFYSPYAFSGNRVVDAIELEGLEPTSYLNSHQWLNGVANGHNAGHGYMFKVDDYWVFESVDEISINITNYQWYDPETSSWKEFQPKKMPNTGKELQEVTSMIFFETALTALRYGSPAEEFYGIVTGEDFDGNEVSRAAQGGWAIVGFIPGGKLLKPGLRVMKGGGKWLKVGNFASKKLLNDHFIKHADDFAGKFRNAEEYVKGAQNFFKRSGETIFEYERKGGDIVRFDKATGAFGIMTDDGTLRTFFKPDEGIDYFKDQLQKDLGDDALKALEESLK